MLIYELEFSNHKHFFFVVDFINTHVNNYIKNNRLVPWMEKFIWQDGGIYYIDNFRSRAR